MMGTFSQFFSLLFESVFGFVFDFARQLLAAFLF